MLKPRHIPKGERAKINEWLREHDKTLRDAEVAQFGTERGTINRGQERHKEIGGEVRLGAGTENGTKQLCPTCNGSNIYHSEGCVTCRDCGDSQCES